MYDEVFLFVDKISRVEVDRIKTKHGTAHLTHCRREAEHRIARHQLFPVDLTHVALPRCLGHDDAAPAAQQYAVHRQRGIPVELLQLP